MLRTTIGCKSKFPQARFRVARTALAKTSQHAILIFDESTSNLDARTEFELFSPFRELARGRTTFIIFLSFSRVGMADRIFVLNEGTIAESGTHQKLMERGDNYSRLYAPQQRLGDAT